MSVSIYMKGDYEEYYALNAAKNKAKTKPNKANFEITKGTRLKVVNNLRRQFNIILRKAGVKKGTFHDIRRTAINMWFANGMSEHDVMILAGHASFATNHEFYLDVADDLVHRASVATVQGLRQKLVHFGTPPFGD